ncbi:MAG TPA: hypothetical protein VGG89_17610 [Candidatus Baltobacteraceae bacterium]
MARQQGWSPLRAARAAAIAGTGHTVSTLAIALVVWLAGLAVAVHYGQLVDTISSLALFGFGSWLTVGSVRELRTRGGTDHARFSHAHLHRHRDGTQHRHWHEHDSHDWHEVDGSLALAAVHEHQHQASSRTALLLILGSSPMIEGIPAFFSASRFGFGLLIVMAVVFAFCTIGTYVAVTLASLRAIRDIDLGPIERYGEVLSGTFIALLGAVFLFFPQLLMK